MGTPNPPVKLKIAPEETAKFKEFWGTSIIDETEEYFLVENFDQTYIVYKKEEKDEEQNGNK